MPVMLERLAAGQAVRFSPRGVSMLPMLREGVDSVVLGLPPERLERFDIPLYQRDNGAFVLHRVVGAGETYTCLGDNQFVLEPGVRPDQVRAVVTGFYRGERFFAMDAPVYRLYVRLWYVTRRLRRSVRRYKGFAGRCLRKLKGAR